MRATFLTREHHDGFVFRAPAPRGRWRMTGPWFAPAAILLGISPLFVTVCVAGGDPVRGKQLAVECFACHGPDGNSPSPVNPRIGGQHEEYLMLALNAYVDGGRTDSLMRGAVLNKSQQDLQDIAAYYASQKSALTGDASPAPPAGPPGARGPAGRGGVKFDHGARTAEFFALKARAQFAADTSQPATGGDCVAPDVGTNSQADRDKDGLPDRYDAAPDDADEFVVDSNGDGRYEICNLQQLQAIVTLGERAGSSTGLTIDERLSRSYQLVRDLDATGTGNFEPIGNCGATGNCMRALGQFGFAGVFDGQGHAIRNLTVDHAERGGVGPFGVLAETGVIMNLRVENVVVRGRAGTGGLVGSNFGVVFQCDVSGAVEAAMAVGGLVGGSGGLVMDSRSAGSVTGQQAVGGLVGDMTGAVFSSRSTANVSGERGVGGLVGLNTFGYVLGSSTAGKVTAVNDVGGLVGVNTDARVRNSFATGDVVATGNNVGGAVGFNSLSMVRNTYAANRVRGADAVGGLVGRNNGTIESGYATGPVTAVGQSGPVTGFVVEGTANAVYPDATVSTTQLSQLTGESTGWAPVAVPAVELLDYFCDLSGDGFIEPEERRADNYIWRFPDRMAPTLRCAAN
ncbi:MAG: cytochrome c [Gammaproteobacteria bacterium]|nr:cytochrome c [Gammaproteobacteria bacterium]